MAPKNSSLYFFDNNPSLSHFLNSLSTLFPRGEVYFMQSITAYLKEIPHLKDEIIKFCQEERIHGVAHQGLNDSFENKDFLKTLENRTEEIISIGTFLFNKRQNLIVTAALEHITYCLASNLLKRTDLRAQMTSEIAEMWECHCIDETSETHSTIAYKIVKELCKNKLEENLLMFVATIALAAVVLEYWTESMCRDPNKKGFKKLVKTGFVLFNPYNGFITQLIPEYLKWYRRDFTPESHFST